MDNNQKEKIGDFLRYIYHNNISVCVTHYDKAKQMDSVSKFIEVLKEKAGNNYACVLDQRNNKILLYDDYCKEYIGYLYGTVEYGYVRGDIHETMMHIEYAVIDNYVYIGGERVAYVDSDNQVTVVRDGIYVIDKLTTSLMKYSDYKLQWKTEIPVNYTQGYTFHSLMDNIGKPYPQGLIAIYDNFKLFHFYRESGKFYGHTHIKKQYELE